MLLLAALAAGEPYQGAEFLLPGWSVPQGMGGNSTVMDWSALSGAANPAMLSHITNRTVAGYGISMWSALVDVFRGGIAVPVGDMKFSADVFVLGGEPVEITALADSSQPMSAQNYPQVVAEKGHYTVAVDLAGAKSVGENFSAGISARLVHRELTGVSGNGFSLSAGVLWEPSARFRAGMLIRDLSTYQFFWSDGVRETGLPSATAGIAYTFVPSADWEITFSPQIAFSPEDGVGPMIAGIALAYRKILTIALGTRDGAITSGAQLNLGRFAIGASGGYHFSLGGSYGISMEYRL